MEHSGSGQLTVFYSGKKIYNRIIMSSFLCQIWLLHPITFMVFPLLSVWKKGQTYFLSGLKLDKSLCSI